VLVHIQLDLPISTMYSYEAVCLLSVCFIDFGTILARLKTTPPAASDAHFLLPRKRDRVYECGFLLPVLPPSLSVCALSSNLLPPTASRAFFC
jgi:hypothetical protein